MIIIFATYFASVCKSSADLLTTKQNANNQPTRTVLALRVSHVYTRHCSVWITAFRFQDCTNAASRFSGICTKAKFRRRAHFAWVCGIDIRRRCLSMPMNTWMPSFLAAS